MVPLNTYIVAKCLVHVLIGPFKSVDHARRHIHRLRLRAPKDSASLTVIQMHETSQGYQMQQQRHGWSWELTPMEDLETTKAH